MQNLATPYDEQYIENIQGTTNWDFVPLKYCYTRNNFIFPLSYFMINRNDSATMIDF